MNLSQWWRRKRRRQSPVWHFREDCPSILDMDKIIVVTVNPRKGTKCDHCQRLQKRDRKK